MNSRILIYKIDIFEDPLEGHGRYKSTTIYNGECPFEADGESHFKTIETNIGHVKSKFELSTNN